jgi:transposase-like protein
MDKRVYTPEEKDAFFKRYAEGRDTIIRIATDMHIPINTAHTWIKIQRQGGNASAAKRNAAAFDWKPVQRDVEDILEGVHITPGDDTSAVATEILDLIKAHLGVAKSEETHI